MDKVENPRRLCSEIQLFDLCSKSSCKHKDGRYCIDGDILARFEAISDDEDVNSADQFLADEMYELEGEDDLGYNESSGDEEYGDEEPEEEDL
jgi:hypothetical protein